jgi:signal peptidase I
MNKKFFVSCLISLLVLLLAYLQPYKVVVVLGKSMHPTLKHGQIVLAKKVTKFEKGDIVVFRNDFEEIVIKRILFMPDEYYYYFIPESNPHYTELIYDNSYRTLLKFYHIHGDHIFEHKIPKDEYYVVGDNHSNSDDSRRFGPISKEQLMYKVIK